jgi:hypothetical protein
MTAQAWQPASTLESSLAEALARDAHDEYRGVLGSATVLIPRQPGADPAAPAWPTAQAQDGRTFIMAFTSLDAMRYGVGTDADSAWPIPFADLAHLWPDPAVWLAVNVATPIQAIVDAAAIQRIASTGEALSFPVDAALRAAVLSDDKTAYAMALVAAELVLPLAEDAEDAAALGDPAFGWTKTTADGAPAIVAYSSRQRLQANLGEVPFTTADTTDVLAAWPDSHTALAVNPGTPLNGLISGAAMRGLAHWVGQVDEAAQEAARAASNDPTLGERERENAAYEAARATITRMLR